MGLKRSSLGQSCPSSLSQMDNKVFITVKEVINATGIGRTNILALMKAGKLKAMKIGRTR